ncbi:hypothetical protein BCE75_110147 [Isoptericola sp. CG 20/1183]|uniref:Fibronectin type-III domain-containing protein n=1 Tax=Isoptericola halotolerans TaxID=300560 RepID=A0ABX5EAR8_9MICO|nr:MULTISPECIES: hypothetical protein [Isoptericola]PRZ04373.1 hypothetical protein BCL65_11034 [Isoptericola halotolerans]PRZ04729.1 hypothetical protein BCE75_110147 [Isoptericola sp. CG 20/1183]
MAERTQPAHAVLLAGLVAVALALTGGGAAWAWWQATAAAEAPPALSAASVDVQVVGLGGGLPGPGGTVTLPALSLTGAFPGGGDSEVVTVRNAGSRATTVTAAMSRTGTLGAVFTTTATFGGTDSGAGCTGGNGSTTTIAAGGTATLCLAVGLSATAPTGTQGQSGGVTTTLAASLPGTSWTDEGTVVSGAVGAGTVPATSLSCGALGVLSVRFNWTSVPGATSYVLRYGTNGSQSETLTVTTRRFTSALSGGTAWVVTQRNFGQVTWSSVPSNTRSYTVAVVSLCG